MKLPSWMLPTLAGVSIVALAIGGAVIGRNFATHATKEVAAGIEVVPVLAPIAIGTEPQTMADSDLTEMSRMIAEREVRLPGADADSVDPSLRDLIDDISDAPDPHTGLFISDEDTDGDSGSGGDPCAPPEGTSDESCPDGLHSTVLPLTGLPDFLISGQLLPPSFDEYSASPDPRFPLWCDGPEATETSLPYGLLTNSPANFTVRFWPTDHPELVTEVTDVSTTDADSENFERAVTIADSPTDLPKFRLCFSLDDLSDADYTLTITGVDIYGRTANPITQFFNPTGHFVHPGAEIVTLGDNLIYVSALHPVNQRVEIEAWASGSTAPESGCSFDHGDDRRINYATSDDIEASSEAVESANAPRNFNRRQVTTFIAPEGSTISVCARWYKRGDLPSWERLHPWFESGAILSSPDRLEMKVEITETSTLVSSLKKVGFLVSSPEGEACDTGASSLSTDFAGNLPMVICNGTYSAGATADDGALRVFPASSDLVIHSTSFFDNDFKVNSRVVLPNVDRGCRGSCSIPEPRWYDMYLGRVTESTGLCGSVFDSDCTPPTADALIGKIRLKVSWLQGPSNGLEDWHLTPVSNNTPSQPESDTPRFDTSQLWSFDEPTFWPDGTPKEFVNGTFPLIVDRPSDYTIRFTDPATGETATECNGTGAPLEASGHVELETTIHIYTACINTVYFGEMQLTDAAGNSVVWSLNDSEHYWAPSGYIGVPGFAVRINYQVSARGIPESDITALSLEVQGENFGITQRTRSGTCTPDGVLQSIGNQEMIVGRVVSVRFELRIQHSDSFSLEDCDRYLNPADLQVITADVSLADLFGPEGAIISSPDGYRPRITLRVDRTG